MKTSTALVDYAHHQLGNPYWWGGFGQIADNSLLTQMKKMYPSVYFSDYYSNASSQFGKRVFDCVGLIKGFRWSESPNSNPVYNPSQDVAVGGLYNQCSKRGSISTMADIKGVCVFIDSSHVGVYIGSGKVIEAKSHADGVVMTALKQRGWTNWGMPDWIQYEDAPVYSDYFSELLEREQKTVSEWPTLHRGQISGFAGALQMLLVYNGYKISVDGDFGAKTFSALVEWQKSMNLEPDGVCGKQTWASFFVK